MEELKDYLEELAAFRRSCLLKFKSHLGAVISLRVKVVQFYKEEGEEFITLDSGNHINIKDVLDVDNKISNSIT